MFVGERGGEVRVEVIVVGERPGDQVRRTEEHACEDGVDGERGRQKREDEMCGVGREGKGEGAGEDEIGWVGRDKDDGCCCVQGMARYRQYLEKYNRS